MKFNISRQQNILTIPADFATLEEVTSDGRFRYAVKFNVDIPKAVREKAFLVKIYASLTPTDVAQPQGFARSDSQEIIKKLLTRQTSLVESNRSFARNVIASITSDITSKIPNDKTSELQQTAEAPLLSEKFLFRKKTFKLAKAAELTNQNISQPTFQTPLFQPTMNEITPARPLPEYGIDLILKHGIDAGQVGNPTYQVVDTGRAFAGVAQQLKGVAREVVANGPIGSIKPAFGILNAVLGDNKGKPSDQLGLANNDYTLIQVEENTNVVTIEEDLYLNVSAVGDQFYLIFSLQNINGIEMERTSSIVPHSRNLSIFTLPTQVPFISATPCTGHNRLELKQLDPNGAGVILYKKIFNTNSATTETNFVQIAKIPIRVSDGSKWYQDPNPGVMTVVYRAVAYNRAEVLSHDFASVVINPSQRIHLVRSFAQQKKLFISINTKVVDKTIQIELNDIPPGVLAMKVYRMDLSRHEKLSEATQIGNLIYLQKIPDQVARFYVTDVAPVNHRIYDYRVKLIFRDGAEFWSPSHSHIWFNPIINNVITTTATPIKAVNSGAELDVVFKLSSVVSEGKMDQIQRAMDQQGILGFYQNDIVQNRDQLQNLIAYQIKRTNITTGEIEDMGVFIGTDFSDTAVGRNRGVKKVQVGHTYEYTINTHFRSAQSLIPGFITTVTNTNNPDRTYTFAPSKWEHPVTLRDGNLVSTTSLKRNHANTDFTFGVVGDILHIRIALGSTIPSIQKVDVSALGKNKILVRWELDGDSRQIDHFLVVREEMGMKTVAGKVHALSDTKSFQFFDTSFSKPVKTNQLSEAMEMVASYYITPVNFDFTHGVSAKSPQTIIKK